MTPSQDGAGLSQLPPPVPAAAGPVARRCPLPVLQGAEAWRHDGGPVGALVLHGFCGSPVSVRPRAEHPAAGGGSVSLPRVPGHGTRWQNANRTIWQDWFAEAQRSFVELQERCDQVVVMGLSVGGC